MKFIAVNAVLGAPAVVGRLDIHAAALVLPVTAGRRHRRQALVPRPLVRQLKYNSRNDPNEADTADDVSINI